MPQPTPSKTQIILATSIAGLVITVALWTGLIPTRQTYTAKSPSPATSDMIQVYEAVLRAWFDRPDSNVLVNEHLHPAPVLSDDEISDCLKGENFRPGAPPTLDSLRGVTFKRKGVHLIDGATWHADDEQLKNDVDQAKFQNADLERAFAHALTSFSQIQFDRNERLAILTFSRVCGDLCGSGSTLLMKKGTNGWKVMKACRQWMS